MGTVIGGNWGSGPRQGSRLLPSRQLIGVVAAVVVIAGLITVGATPFSVGTASTPPLAVKQAWLHYLDDAPCGVAEASPAEVTLDQSGPSVEVADREGYLYSFHLSDGSVPAAWNRAPASVYVNSGQACGIAGNDGATAKPAPGTNGIAVPGNPPIDSTASVASTPDGSFIYFGAGNAADPGVGGYYAYGPAGDLKWSKVVSNPPTDPLDDIGIQASPTLVTTNATPFVTAGSLGQESDALDATTGSPVSGWPYFSADSVFSTAAVADLYGTGQDELVVGGASTDGIAYGRHYQNGGHLRILNDHGGLICSANTNEEIDSSPAIGPILPEARSGSPREPAASTRGATRTRSRSSTHSATRCGARPSTGLRAGARHWPTCAATVSSSSSRARVRRIAPARSGLSTLRRERSCGKYPRSARSSAR